MNKATPQISSFYSFTSASIMVLSFSLNNAVPASACSPTVPADPLSQSTLLYVSDYFSFVGTDNQGRVAFALDNNRGRDGDSYQAEHFVVLHDERTGWIDIAGNGRYENAKRELVPTPDSPFFRFQGTPETGLTITSVKDHLILRVDPIPQRTRRSHDGSIVWMGSAPGVLTWQSRTIPGRVIYEHLIMPNFNRLTRTYPGLWKEFQGLYLSIDGKGDFYVHAQRSPRLEPLVGRLAGFVVVDDQPTALDAEHLEFGIAGRRLALGFYRWPTAWEITWKGSKGPARMTLALFEQKKIANWVIGGFSMGIVRGELSYDGRTWPIYGLAELIM